MMNPAEGFIDGVRNRKEDTPRRVRASSTDSSSSSSSSSRSKRRRYRKKHRKEDRISNLEKTVQKLSDSVASLRNCFKNKTNDSYMSDSSILSIEPPNDLIREFENNSNPTKGVSFKVQTTLKNQTLKTSDSHLNMINNLQHFDSPDWSQVRYADTQKLYNSVPGFVELETNDLIKSFDRQSHMSVNERTFAALSHGLIMQNEALQAGLVSLVNWLGDQQEPIATDMISTKINEIFSNGEYSKIFSDLLQIVCGRRADLIQQRRESVLYYVRDKYLSETIKKIPPSGEHIFNDGKLTDFITKQGGIMKVFTNQSGRGGFVKQGLSQGNPEAIGRPKVSNKKYFHNKPRALYPHKELNVKQMRHFVTNNLNDDVAVRPVNLTDAIIENIDYNRRNFRAGQLKHQSHGIPGSSVGSMEEQEKASKSQAGVSTHKDMGDSRNRPLCIQDSSCGPELRHPGLSRQKRRVSQCVQSSLALQVGMDLPTSMLNPSGPVASECSERNLPNNCSRLGEGILETRFRGACLKSTATDTESRTGTSGQVYQPSTTAGTTYKFTSVADTGWSSLLKSWHHNQINILDNSWRKSTIRTYKSAWLRWLKWSHDNMVNAVKPLPEDVARFLTDLHLIFKLSYSSIALHKSVVSTFCKPIVGSPLSSHIIIRQALKGIALQQPKKSKSPIWDIKLLINYLETNIPVNLSLFEISKRTAVLLLLCSGRRVHDLTLLQIDDKCEIDTDCIVFWPDFGSKTDSINFRQSGWKLLRCESNRNIDPVFWVKKLLEQSTGRRGDIKSLFISTCGSPKPASRTVIGGWIKHVLRDAGIDSSPGSIRSAVASSSWVDNTPIDEILTRGNWRSAVTFHKYYKKQIAPSLNNANQNLLQNHFQSV